MDAANQDLQVISFEGTLDVERARSMLATALAPGSSRGDVVFDLRGAREIHDAAIVLIVSTMEAERRRLEVRGLGSHHRKLLELIRSDSGPWQPAFFRLPN